MGHRKLLANTLCLRVGLAVSLLAIVLPAEAGYWMTPEFSRDEERPLVLALLPPRAEVVQVRPSWRSFTQSLYPRMLEADALSPNWPAG